MKTKVNDYRTIAKELKKDYNKLTDFEILTLAIQIERNQILENGLVVSQTGNNPSGLEAIAISLGFSGGQLQTTITDVLQKIANKE